MADLDLLVDRAETAGALKVYKVGAVPTTNPGDAYIVLGLDTGTPTSTRTDGRSPNTTRRITAQLHSRWIEGVLDMAEYADEAFKDVVLTELDGDPYCWREMATQPARDPDAGGWLYALHTYRY